MSKKSAKIQSRPPIVVVLGHVDHGKTSILDKIRETKIAQGESGGITQHISACQIEFQNKLITFIDTPGHKAFSKMRARGAKIADVALLIVAADEGVKPQTIEAIEYINKKKIPTIIAFNKIDKPIANIEKAKTQLADNGILTEDRGGDVPAIGVSAQTGQGIDDLLELILLLSEMQEIKLVSCPKGLASQGIIVESWLDPERGNLALVILQKGLLKTGDFIRTEQASGRVKILENWQKKKIKTAQTADPVFVIGLGSPTESGEIVLSSKNEISKQKYLKVSKISAKTGKKNIQTSLDPDKKKLNLIIKADTQGSLQAVLDSLMAIQLEQVSLRVLGSGIGMISASDVKAALPTRALLIGFHIKTDKIAKELIHIYKLDFKSYDVIYEIINEVQEKAKKMIGPIKQRIDLGQVKIIAVFKQEKDGMIVGGPVISGKAVKNAQVDVLRDKEKIGQGRIKKLEHKNNDLGEVGKGREAGIYFQGDAKIQEGDILEVFKIEKV